MNENLMVNSKTDILEFKRKHNLLVANGTIKANVSNIKSLSNDVINNLRCGDVVLKEDSTGKHAYLVSFKSDTGLCLTYCDAYCVETQSYDKEHNNWVYNSEDKTIIAEPQMENIVDSQGHKRFIEGVITFDEITGLVQKFGKWSLSGSHLLIVVAGTLENGTTLNGKIATVNLPKWIKDKLVVLYGIAVVRQNDYAYANDGSSNQTMLDVLAKQQNNIEIHSYNITTTAERQFRMQFDLLIDNA